MVWAPGSLFLITGITTSQTGIFKNNIRYGNIEWNNTAQTAYYAFRNTLDSANVQGSFTVKSTGTSYITFVNASGRVKFPGQFNAVGGQVNFRESGNGTDTLEVGDNFVVTSTFNSNASATSPLFIKLTGINKRFGYFRDFATNTNLEIAGSYLIGNDIVLPTPGFGIIVSGAIQLVFDRLLGPGNFTLLPAATLQVGQGYGIEGNVMVTGTKLLSTAANYIYDNGTDGGAQATGLLLPAIVNTIKTEGIYPVTLSATVNATNALIFGNKYDALGSLSTSSLLIAGNYNMVADTITGANSNKYVVTSGTGVLKVTTVGAGTNLFPVGPTTTSYNPVTINNSGTIDNFAVSVKTTFNSPVPNPNAVVNRQWTIAEDLAGGSNATLSFSWLTADQAPGFNPAFAVSIIRYNGTIWVATPAVVTGAGTVANPYVATAPGFTSFSPFAVINDVALPLTLLNFNAGYINTVLNVWWSTTRELNTASFEVERSADGRFFNSIATVAAASNTSGNQYKIIDASPLDGIAYYRLKMIDKDGSFRYSQVVIVNNKLKGIITVYPNPAVSLLTITHEKATANTTVEVLTTEGKKALSKKLQLNAVQSSLNISALAPGEYWMVISNGTERTSIPFIKQ